MSRLLNRLKSCGRLWIAAASVTIAGILPAPAQAELNPHDVDNAVEKASKYLLSQQQKDGSWEVGAKAGPKEAGHAWGGETAIVTYALLSAGHNPQEPEMKKAIEWLENEDLHGTYAVGLRSQVWHLIAEKVIPGKAPPPAVIAGRERDKEFVLWSRGLTGAGKGFYSYSYGTESSLSYGRPKLPLSHAGSGGGDRSNSQYGVLGAWALEQAGAEIPTSFWLEEDEAWKKDQNVDGGWSYGGRGGDSTATMTAAGLASLFITQDYVMRATPHLFDTCRGGVTNSFIEKGLAWMDKHAVAALNGGPYGLYGIERIGVASGRKYFGVHDWYKMGAERLVKTQGATGSWGALHDTCFCLLFLVRGRAPVMMNKLQYDNPITKMVDPWNERPRDVANLSKWMGTHSLEDFLNWQIVNLNVSVDELHDAPILYISGSTELVLSNQDIDKLRQFVEQGGMILGNADCNSKAFAQSFQKLGSKLFPKYEFRKLPASHPIFDEQYHAVKWKKHPTVLGLSNGVRELVVLFPDSDPSHAWQTESYKAHEEDFQLAGNVFLYATGKENLTHKGDTYIVHAQGPATRPVKVARIAVGENWDPEPGSWRRLAAVMHNTRKVDIKTEPVKLGEGKLAGFKIAHLTGTTRLKLGADQQKELKDFVDKGGTLIVDAAGGAHDFADSAEAELGQIWGDAAAKGLASPLPPEHLLFSTPGALADHVTYRIFARQSLVGHVHDPRIRGIVVDKGRIGIFYSREDLTAGLVGEPVDGIIGYIPAYATQLMSNMIMYADLGGVVIVPPPATKPTTGPSTKPTTLPTKAPTAAPVAAPIPPVPAPAPAAPAPVATPPAPAPAPPAPVPAPATPAPADPKAPAK